MTGDAAEPHPIEVQPIEVQPIEILVDADACPVKAEAIRVAERYGVAVHFVANAVLTLPVHPLVHRVLVGAGFDAADDWIAGRAHGRAVAVTADLPLAARCLDKGAQVIGPTGRVLTQQSIGSALAGRELSAHLRAMGEQTRGPAPMSGRDRSQFLSALDTAIQRLRRGR